jgi:hypothetical protein
MTLLLGIIQERICLRFDRRTIRNENINLEVKSAGQMGKELLEIIQYGRKCGNWKYQARFRFLCGDHCMELFRVDISLLIDILR